MWIKKEKQQAYIDYLKSKVRGTEFWALKCMRDE